VQCQFVGWLLIVDYNRIFAVNMDLPEFETSFPQGLRPLGKD